MVNRNLEKEEFLRRFLDSLAIATASDESILSLSREIYGNLEEHTKALEQIFAGTESVVPESQEDPPTEQRSPLLQALGAGHVVLDAETPERKLQALGARQVGLDTIQLAPMKAGTFYLLNLGSSKVYVAPGLQAGPFKNESAATESGEGSEARQTKTNRSKSSWRRYFHH